jgi:hypothetical protein
VDTGQGVVVVPVVSVPRHMKHPFFIEEHGRAEDSHNRQMYIKLGISLRSYAFGRKPVERLVLSFLKSQPSRRVSRADYVVCRLESEYSDRELFRQERTVQ